MPLLHCLLVSMSIYLDLSIDVERRIAALPFFSYIYRCTTPHPHTPSHLDLSLYHAYLFFSLLNFFPVHFEIFRHPLASGACFSPSLWASFTTNSGSFGHVFSPPFFSSLVTFSSFAPLCNGFRSMLLSLASFWL